MDKGYKQIRWGFIFLIVHINLGNIRLLPTCISYLIIYRGIERVSKDRNIKALTKSAEVCMILMIMSLIIEVISLWKAELLIQNPIFHIVWFSACGILKISMMYNFLNGSGEILESEDNMLVSTYSKKVDIYVILATILLAVSNINIAFRFSYVWAVLCIFELCLNIWIINSSKELVKNVTE